MSACLSMIFKKRRGTNRKLLSSVLPLIVTFCICILVRDRTIYCSKFLKKKMKGKLFIKNLKILNLISNTL